MYIFSIENLEPFQRIEIVEYMKETNIKFKLQESKILIFDATVDFESYINDHNILIERIQ